MRVPAFASFSSATALLLLLWSFPALADAKGDEVLRKYDAAAANYKDLYAKYQMTIYESSGKKVIKFTMYERSGGKRLLKFTSPADIRGQMVLIQSQSEMYVYLPAFKRVRRVAGHVKNQGFLSSDFTYDDMAISTWAQDYDARLVRETKAHWYLECKAKKGRKPAFPRLKMLVRKRDHKADLIEYLSWSGRKLRTQTFMGWSCHSGNQACSPKLVRLVDHRRGNHTTEIMQLSRQFNKGISDRKFTLRYLARGE